MTVLEAVEKRFFARDYAEKPVEPEKLERIMRAGWLAPTASNQQEEQADAVTDLELRRKLVDACEGREAVFSVNTLREATPHSLASLLLWGA